MNTLAFTTPCDRFSAGYSSNFQGFWKGLWKTPTQVDSWGFPLKQSQVDHWFEELAYLRQRTDFTAAVANMVVTREPWEAPVKKPILTWCGEAENNPALRAFKDDERLLCALDTVSRPGVELVTAMTTRRYKPSEATPGTIYVLSIALLRRLSAAGVGVFYQDSLDGNKPFPLLDMGSYYLL